MANFNTVAQQNSDRSKELNQELHKEKGKEDLILRFNEEKQRTYRRIKEYNFEVQLTLSGLDIAKTHTCKQP